MRDYRFSEWDWRRLLEDGLALPRVRWLWLAPTPRTLLADLALLKSQHPKHAAIPWHAEDWIAVESRVLMATAPPLCLAPNPAVFQAKRTHHYNLRKNLLVGTARIRFPRKLLTGTTHAQRSPYAHSLSHTVSLLPVVLQSAAGFGVAVAAKSQVENTSQHYERRIQPLLAVLARARPRSVVWPRGKRGFQRGMGAGASGGWGRGRAEDGRQGGKGAWPVCFCKRPAGMQWHHGALSAPPR